MGKWEIVRLGDIASFINGFPFNPNDWSNEGMPIIRIQNLTGSSETFNCFNGTYNNKYVVTKGDILISWSASLGVYEWSKENALLNQHIFKVVFDKREINKRFFTYVIRLKLNEMIEATHGSTMKHITKKHFDDISISLPPLRVQQKIADALDKASALIEMRKAQLEKLDLLIKSQFIEMFGDPVTNPKGWEKEVLQDHADILSGYPFNSDNFSDKGIKICGGLIIMPNNILWDECKYLESSRGYEGYLLNENDIVMAMDRPWISEGFKIATMERNRLPALLIQRTARIRGIDINQEYLYMSLIIGGFDRHCNITGSLVPHISIKDIRSFEIMIPPLVLQEGFEVIAKQIKKQKLQLQLSLNNLSINYQTLLQKCFNGELFA